MYGIDKLKLVMNLNDIDIINEEVFIKKVEKDELIGLSYNQKEPFSLMIKIDYENEEAVVEFTGKVLLSNYHSLIRLSNIKECFENINSLGICKIRNYLNAKVVKCDITNDYLVVNIKKLSEFLRGNLSSYRKYIARDLNNGNFVIEKNVTTKQCKKRLSIYNKFWEMEKAENRKFIDDYYNGENPFVFGNSNNCRIELNLNSKEQIRSSLKITDTKLFIVLRSAQSVNPIYDFLSEIIDKKASFDSHISKIKDYHLSLTLKDCDYDIKKVEARLKPMYSKGTKMRAVLKPYKKMLEEIQLGEQKGYTRDEVLNLVRKETQITNRLILDNM